MPPKRFVAFMEETAKIKRVFQGPGIAAWRRELQP
jgi:hypothetical protein